MTEQHHHPGLLPGRTLLTLFSVMLVGSFLTAALFREARKSELETFRLQFERDAAMRCNLIADKIQDCLITIKALQRFFAGSDHVDGNDFTSFTVPFLEDQKELQALEWVPRVTSAERAHYEDLGRSQGVPDFRIVESGPDGNLIPAKIREIHYPVFYIEPLEGNEKALGFDLVSAPDRIPALEQARDTGEPAVTERIRLIQETGEQFGFLIYFPVYRKGMPTETVQQRRSALEGFALGVFRAGNVLKAALGSTEPLGLPFDLLDLSAPVEKRLLHRWSARLNPKAPWESPFFPAPLRYLGKFYVAGREWGVEITTSPAYMELYYPFGHWAILPAGFLITLVLAFYLRAILGQRLQLERTVLERTAELQESEECFRTIFDSVNDAVFVLDLPTGAVLDVNRCMCELYGYTRDEACSMDFSELGSGKSPFGRRNILQWIEKAASGEPQIFDWHAKDKEGRLFWVELNLQRATIHHKDRLLITARDITKRKIAEKALHESEIRLRNILQTANEGFWLIDNNTITTDLNRRMCSILGRNREDALGRKIFEFVDEDNKAIFQHQVELRERGLPGAYEIALSRPDASHVLCHFNVTPLFDGLGDRIGTFAMATDISERKQAEDALRHSEAKYRELFAAVSDAILVLDANTLQIIDVNQSALHCYGYTREEFLSLKATDVTEDREISRKFIEEAVSKQQFRIPLRYHRRKDGSVFPVEISAVRFLFREQALVCSVVRDLTERKRAEEEKEKLEAELHQARKMEAIGLLAGGIAHDFNNMLAVIMGFTELSLFKISKRNPIRGNLEHVLKAASRASEVVKQILTFARKGVQERKPVRMSPIVMEALKLLRSSLPSTIEIRHEFALKPGEDVVFADPGQIHQVLMNFGTNAGHAMRAKGGILIVKLSVVTDGSQLLEHPGLKAGPHVCLTVSDTGHGMDSTVLERIFDPYFTTKGLGEGTGLGLSVVQGIVKSHNGAITVKSIPGQGTTFSVFLPGLNSANKEDAASLQSPPNGRERILLVDDEEALVDMGKAILETLGYQVTARKDSREALEVFRKQPGAFDLIITDMTMPFLTGKELSEKMIALRPDTPIILSTGFSDLVDESQAKEAGIREFVTKPYEIRTLADAVRKALGKQ
jgi:PAS domain S-box-containing protein